VSETIKNSLDPITLEAREFILDSPFITVDDSLKTYALPSFTPDRRLLEAVNDLMNRVYTGI
jgi:hypothetical protein